MIYDNDIIQRADGDDWLHGGSWLNKELPDLDDTIYGGGGDDIITGGKGGDTILGGPGHDRIDGAEGDDWLYGDYRPEDYDDYDPAGPYSHDGDGNDEIYGWHDDDEIYGAGGHDNLFGDEDGALYFVGGAGEDWIVINNSEAASYAVSNEYPRVDLLADCNVANGFEDYLGSQDNREENGFHGGKKITQGVVPVEVRIDFDQNGDPGDPSWASLNYQLRLDSTDESILRVWTDQQKTEEIPLPATWVIGQDPIPWRVYVQGITNGQALLKLTLLDSSGEPLPPAERPLPDLLCFTVNF